MNITLILLGILSAVMCYVHWKVSIVPLYSRNENEGEAGEEEAEKMSQGAAEEAEDQLW